jgi:hypothetical protein
MTIFKIDTSVRGLLVYHQPSSQCCFSNDMAYYCWYFCWWTIRPLGYHSPSSHCVGTDMFIRYIYYWNVQCLNNVIITNTNVPPSDIDDLNKVIIANTNVPPLRHRWPYQILTILFRPFCYLLPKLFKIIWLSNLSSFSVPDEDYSRPACNKSFIIPNETKKTHIPLCKILLANIF